MKKYQYTIALTEANETDADQKMKAITMLASKLSTKELQRLAQVVEHDPIKTAFAKKALGL